VEHLARVEGHGGVLVELDGDKLCKVQFEIFEGMRLLESIVKGRGYEDVGPMLSRICSICSGAHSLTSLKATEAAFGVEVGPQTRTLRELLLRGGNIASHALHLFLLAAPDYLDASGAAEVAVRNPDAVKLGLRLKKLGNSIQDVIGGRAIHPVNVVPGGFAVLPATEDLIGLRDALLEGARDCQTAIDFMAALPAAEPCRTSTGFASVRSADGSYGYYGGDEVIIRFDDGAEVLPVADYRKLTNEKAVPHSNALHSTWKGRPFMVGALARLSERRGTLGASAAQTIAKLGLSLPSGNPTDNNKAQAVELAMDVAWALKTVEKLIDSGFTEEARVPVHPRRGTGIAVTEAPRGLLFHRYTYDEAGRVESADVITPTAINAASVEDHMRAAVTQNPGASEPLLTKHLEMVVRAYDPCISCSVHVMQKRK
jgi:sulfhydrogenase subunit alpha